MIDSPLFGLAFLLSVLTNMSLAWTLAVRIRRHDAAAEQLVREDSSKRAQGSRRRRDLIVELTSCGIPPKTVTCSRNWQQKRRWVVAAACVAKTPRTFSSLTSSSGLLKAACTETGIDVGFVCARALRGLRSSGCPFASLS